MSEEKILNGLARIGKRYTEAEIENALRKISEDFSRYLEESEAFAFFETMAPDGREYNWSLRGKGVFSPEDFEEFKATARSAAPANLRAKLEAVEA